MEALPSQTLGAAPLAAQSAAAVGPARTLVIACGALAREFLALRERNGWAHLDIACLPASLHNTPRRIPEAVRAKIREHRPAYDRILCLYGDCGTGGALDRVLEEEGVLRIAGAHCYAFYAGPSVFEAWQEEEVGTFYLTDFLVRHFDTLVIEGLGLDRHPHLLEDYFKHYTRVLYLAQLPDADLEARARAAARRLNLPLVIRSTGLERLEGFLRQL